MNNELFLRYTVWPRIEPSNVAVFNIDPGPIQLEFDVEIEHANDTQYTIKRVGTDLSVTIDVGELSDVFDELIASNWHLRLLERDDHWLLQGTPPYAKYKIDRAFSLFQRQWRRYMDIEYNGATGDGEMWKTLANRAGNLAAAMKKKYTMDIVRLVGETSDVQ